MSCPGKEGGGEGNCCLEKVAGFLLFASERSSSWITNHSKWVSSPLRAFPDLLIALKFEEFKITLKFEELCG